MTAISQTGKPLLNHAGRLAPLRGSSVNPGPTPPAGARARYMALELRQRKLLAALAAHDGEVPNDVLATAVQTPPGVTFGTMVRLCEAGMAIQTPAGWKLEDWVLPLAREDLASSVHVALVIPQDDLLRPPCDSVTERRIFQVCLHLFEGSAVLPNVPLSRIVDPEAAGHYLDHEDRKFLGNPSTQVDIVILGKSLLPVLAIEADGPQHDVDPQHSRDARKDRILRIAGLPVARLRVRAQMSDDALAHHVGKALWEAARIARPSHRGRVELARALSRVVPLPAEKADVNKGVSA